MFSSFTAIAESGWRAKLRPFLKSTIGLEVTNKILGAEEIVISDEISMPKIPVSLNKNSQIQSYSKLKVGQTEFDKLPAERKRKFNYLFIQEVFSATRLQDPTEEEVMTWLSNLEQGGSREGLYQALVLDPIYARLESQDEKPSSGLVKTVKTFSHKFLNQTFKDEVLNQLNLFSLKRLLTEKGLDILDYYETTSLENLYAWYAHFSVDMAQIHADAFTSDLRKSTSLKVHYDWAKQVPVQQVKSEFIIKFHKALNKSQSP